MAMRLRTGLGLSRGRVLGGVSYSAEAEALFARMSVAPDATRKGLINTAILSLLTGAVSGSNIWAKLDALYLIAAHDSQAGRLNWKGTSYTLTMSGGMGTGDFTTDRGFTGDAVAKWLDTGLADNTAAINWSQDSACFGCWVNQDNATVNSSMGAASSANLRILPKDAGTTGSVRLHKGTSLSVAGQTTRLGFCAANRSTSTANQFYRGGSSIGTSATVSTAPAATNISILRASSTYSNDRVAAAVIGGSLTANEHTDLYNALNTFLTAIGGA